MNNKALATIILAILLIGTFATAISFVAVTKADTTYHNLTIDYAPNPMIGSVVPSTAPAVGTYPETENSKINITAPDPVSVGTGIQYVFQNWTFWDDTTNASADSSTNNPFFITMNHNYTATAMYKLQYLFTVTTQYDTAYIYDQTNWYTNGSDIYTVSHWFDAGTKDLQAYTTFGQVVLGSGHIAEFTSWGGNASGGPQAPITGNQWSNKLNLTGPMIAVGNWKEEYYLWTDTTYMPFAWGTPFDPDSQQGYFTVNTYANLTAPTYDQVYPNFRWRFDRWEINNHNGTAWNVNSTRYTENITVLMDQIHWAVVYYQMQYYLTVQSSPSYLDQVEYQSGYKDYGSYVVLRAPQTITDPTDPVGSQWNFSHWFINIVVDCYNTTLTVQILGIWTAYAIYTQQFLVRIKTTPALVLGMGTFTGAGWYNKGDPWTVQAWNTTIQVDDDTRYVFVMWDFTESGDATTPSNPAGPWNIYQAWNATAVYTKQYRAIFAADPSSLNSANPGYPGEVWADENTNVTWYAASGPISAYPYDFYFDHWTVNGMDKAQYVNQFPLNFTGPKTTVAHYLGKTALFITPQTVYNVTPAYCTTFQVNVTAANLVDLYALDFNVTWNPTLLELVSSNVKVSQIWNQSIYWEKNVTGNYHLMATQTAPGLGFNSTHTIVTLTFHRIYDPCYISPPYYNSCVIGLVGPALGGTWPQLSDSKGNGILPWNTYGAYYEIDAVKPTLYMNPSTKTVSKKDATFAVEIWIRNATKLSDWWTTVTYNATLLQVTNVVLDTTFLTGNYSINNVNFALPGFVTISVAQLLPGNPANGTGRLATIYFQVILSIFWTKAYRTLSCTIGFWTFDWLTGISVMCPTKAYAYATASVGVENCLYTYKPIEGDVNKDGVVNSLDLQLVAADYGSSTTYDLDGNLKVDLLDIVLVAINFGKTSPGY